MLREPIESSSQLSSGTSSQNSLSSRRGCGGLAAGSSFAGGGLCIALGGDLSCGGGFFGTASDKMAGGGLFFGLDIGTGPDTGCAPGAGCGPGAGTGCGHAPIVGRTGGGLGGHVARVPCTNCAFFTIMTLGGHCPSFTAHAIFVAGSGAPLSIVGCGEASVGKASVGEASVGMVQDGKHSEFVGSGLKCSAAFAAGDVAAFAAVAASG